MPNRSLPNPSSGFERLHHLLHRHADTSSELATAAAPLGSQHPLAHILDLATVLRRQVVVAALAVGGGAIALAAGAKWAIPLTSAAAVVELLLLISFAAVSSSKRRVACELLIEGRTDLPLRVIERERARLTDPPARAHAARSLDRIVKTAAMWKRIQPNLRPVWNPRVIRSAAPRLIEIAATLRSEPAQPQTMLRIERLLTEGASPLYGDDPAELEDELDLISRQLERSRDLSK